LPFPWRSQKIVCEALLLCQRCCCRSCIARHKSLTPLSTCDLATNQAAMAHHTGVVELMGVDIPGPCLTLLRLLAMLAAPVWVHVVFALFPATFGCYVLSAILHQATPENTPVNWSFFAKSALLCWCAVGFAISTAAKATTTVIIPIASMHGLIPGAVTIASG